MANRNVWQSAAIVASYGAMRSSSLSGLSKQLVAVALWPSLQLMAFNLYSA